MLYCTVNPATAGIVGNVIAPLQVFSGAVNAGAVGNITILTILLVEQELGEGPGVPATVFPQAAVRIYRACIV